MKEESLLLLSDLQKLINQVVLIDYTIIILGGNLFEKRENKENEMVIMNVAEQWLVYATDERASKITGSEKKFKTEEEALDNFITRLRALNVLKN